MENDERRVNLEEFLISEFEMSANTGALQHYEDELKKRWKDVCSGLFINGKVPLSKAIELFSPVVVAELHIWRVRAKKAAEEKRKSIAWFQSELDRLVQMHTKLDQLLEWKFKIVPSKDKPNLSEGGDGQV